MTLRQLITDGRSRLTPLYGSGEAEWMMRIIIEHLKGWSQVDIITHADDTISDFISSKTDDIIKRLLDNEPIQYITGDTYWHGMTLKVTPDVLIPRPETSELIDIMAADLSGSDLRVLDVCTGSGCIAIALASALRFPQISAIDISPEALKVATENASARHAAISFSCADALRPLPFPDSSFDVVVSNPPYVLDSEKKDMPANVRDHEPSIALFVPDSDPLRFYTPIISESMRITVPGGRIYLEINPLEADAVSGALDKAGWDEIEILNDSHGRRRFARAVHPS